MTRLHPDDISAIINGIVRQLRVAETQQTDAAYLATLPRDVRMKIQREKMREEDRRKAEAKAA